MRGIGLARRHKLASPSSKVNVSATAYWRVTFSSLARVPDLRSGALASEVGMRTNKTYTY